MIYLLIHTFTINGDFKTPVQSKYTDLNHFLLILFCQ